VFTEGEAVWLTAEGRELARNVVRRHRLAERLLVDLLDVGREDVEGPACRFEHVLNQGVDDRICTLLGHPPTCPHGKLIPRGLSMCSTARGLQQADDSVDRHACGATW